MDLAWSWNTLDLTSSKASSRPALPKQVAWDLVGVDGSQQGGLRPSNGFRRVHTIERPGAAEHGTSSVLLDFWPVDFYLGASDYGYGVAYAVLRHSGSGIDILMDWVRGSTGAVSRGVTLVSNATGSASAVPEMSVVAMGRFVFAFVRGQSPTMTYWSTGSGSLVNLTAPGPGTATTITVNSASDAKLYITNNGSYSSTVANLQPGRYTAAYQLMDTRTGRLGPVSSPVDIEAEDFPTAGTGVYAPKFTLTLANVDTTKWDRLLAYRSVRAETIGQVYVSGILHLDKIVTISSSTVAHVYELSDKALSMQDPMVDRMEFDATMPYGGVACSYQGTLFTSRISGTGTSSQDPESLLASNVGELRWSSSLRIMPEHFSPGNRFVPENPAQEMVALQKAGGYLIGFSRDRLFHIRKASGVVRVEEIHEGYGVCGRDAAAKVGGMVYFGTTKGLKAVAGDGQLDDVAAMDDYFSRRWVGRLSNVSMAFDGVANCLIVLCPNSTGTEPFGEAGLLWFGTYRATSFEDLPFWRVRSGRWASRYWDGALSPTAAQRMEPLVQHALLLQRPSSEGWPTGRNAYLYVLDHERIKSVGQTTLDPGADTSGLRAELQGVTGTSLEVGFTAPDALVGGRVYVLKAEEAEVGASASITAVSGSTLTIDEEIDGLAEGDVVAVTPVKFRWVGSNLHRPMQEGEDAQNPQDTATFFQVKTLSSVGACFGLVAATNDANPTAVVWKGQVWRGMEDSPSAEAIPLSRSGEQVASVVEGESKDYANLKKHSVPGVSISVGVETTLPEVDFRLLSVVARGTLTSTSRTSMPST